MEDKKSPTADAFADTLLRMFFGLRFRRRGEEQKKSVLKLSSLIFDGRREEACSR